MIEGLSKLRELSPAGRTWAQQAFAVLASHGISGRLYDVYRSPQQQEKRFRAGDTRARAWQSPHQYGLAFDFVVSAGEQSPLQRQLQAAWNAAGLRTISWDPAHVEYPNWKALT